MTRTPSPAATAIAIVPIPTDVPSTWGIVGRRPNWIPEAHSIKLFGPGLAALTNEKAANAASSLIPASTGRQFGLGTIHESTVRWALPCVLYDLRVSTPPGLENVRAWKPSVPGIREVFHARFVDHVYPRHTHDTWTLFIVDQGIIRYDLERKEHGALPAMVTILPPGVVHDGHPVSGDGFRKRVLYLETSLLGEHLTGNAVDRPIIRDMTLRRRVSAVHRLLAAADNVLEAETRMAFIAERIKHHLGQRSEDRPWVAPGELAEAFRAFLDGHLFEPVTLAAAGNTIGANPTHLARSFTKAFGIAPHTYLLGRRIDAARQRLLEGQPPADVAVSVGFYDQAHFTHHFKRHTGTTPGRFNTEGILFHSQ